MKKFYDGIFHNKKEKKKVYKEDLIFTMHYRI